MKRFRVDGLWSKTRDGKGLVPGRLSNGKSGLSLFLYGSLNEGWTPDAPVLYEKLYGLIGAGLEGSYATLFDCHTELATISSSSVRTEKLRCGWAIIGNDLAPEELEGGETLKYEFTYLGDWAAMPHNRWKVDWSPRNQAPSVQYEGQEPIEFLVDDFKIRVEFMASLFRSRCQSGIRDTCGLTISPAGPGSLNEVSRLHMSRIRNFLTFATDIPNGIDRVILSSKAASDDNAGGQKRFALYYAQAGQARRDEHRLHPVDMLFNLADVKSRGLDVFQNWYRFSQSHSSFIDVYFAHVHSPPSLLPDRFRGVMMAFRCLTQMTDPSEETEMALPGLERAPTFAEVEPGGDKRWLEWASPTRVEMETPSRLLASLERNRGVMSLVIDDFPEFVTRILASLDYVDRRRSRLSATPFRDAELYYAADKVRWLIKFMVLREIGFGDEDLTTIADRNRKFTFLRSR